MRVKDGKNGEVWQHCDPEVVVGWIGSLREEERE